MVRLGVIDDCSPLFFRITDVPELRIKIFASCDGFGLVEVPIPLGVFDELQLQELFFSVGIVTDPLKLVVLAMLGLG